MQKSLYGCLKSALLFDEKLVSDLKSRGFIVNPYDPYVANMMVNAYHMTITWHINHLRISHIDPDEVKNS